MCLSSQFVEIATELVTAPAVELRMVFRAADADADDRLSWDELIAYLHGAELRAEEDRTGVCFVCHSLFPLCWLYHYFCVW